MKVLAIVQARMGSTRLPGKVLRDLAGEPMLARVVARLSRAGRLAGVVVATTTQPADDAVAGLCRSRSWPVFRGREEDVLDRYYQAARAYAADAVVRVTADCPLIEPAVVDRVVREFAERQPEVAYVSNVVPTRTYPHGLDTEVFTFAALERAWREDANPTWREHVTPYLYRRPELFRIYCVCHDSDLSTMRWTVDTPEDWEFVNRVYRHFGHDRFSWHDVLALLEQRPDWQQLNRHVRQRTVE